MKKQKGYVVKVLLLMVLIQSDNKIVGGQTK